MTETHATAAIFPPGRYGRRRRARRTPRWVGVVLASVVVVVGLLLAARLNQQYGDPTYRVTMTRVTDVTDSGLTVDFTVTVPAGGSAACVVRARAYSGEEVGIAQVTANAPAGERLASARYRLPTTKRPYAGDVVRCAPPRG